jgi:uncharacterized RDD family membrane protein YckC
MKDFKYVGFWQRVLSNLIDSVIWSVLMAVIGSLYLDSIKIYETVPLIYLWVFSYITVALYTIIFWKLFGATPGKLIIRVKIRDTQSGNIPSIRKLIIRFFFYPISMTFFAIGCIRVGFDSRKQSWHDKVAGTVVVRIYKIKKKKEIEPDIVPEKIESLFPTSPSLKDLNNWTWEKFLLIFASVCVISIIYFAHYADESLIPKAKKWLYEPEFVESNPEDNGFYHLIGLFKPEDQSSVDAGLDWVKTNNDFVFEKHKNNELEYPELRQDTLNTNLDFKEILGNFNSESFVAYCKDNEKKITQAYTQLDYIKTRLKTISEVEYFRNTTFPHFLSREQIHMSLVHYSLLKKCYVANLYGTGSKREALSILDNDIKFIRGMLKNSDYLISKMVFTILLVRDLKTYNHLLNYETSDLTHLTKSIRHINLLSVAERDLEKVAKRNFSFDVSTFLYVYNLITKQKDFICKNSHFTKDVVNSSRSVLFKPNKSINQYFLKHHYLADLSKVTGKEFIELDKNPYIFQPTFIDFVTNYLNTMIMLEVDVSYIKYVASFHDIDAYINMLKLKLMIIEQNISSEKIPEFLEAHKDSLNNPYTEEAFDWDAERSILRFDGPYDDDHDLRKVKINR